MPTSKQKKEAPFSEMSLNDSIYKSMVEHSANVILLLDNKGTIQYANKSLSIEFGHEPKGITGRKIWECIHPDDISEVRKKFERLNEKDEKKLTVEFRLQHMKGSWAYASTTLYNEVKNENINGIIATISNITKEKAIEQELQLTIKNNEAILKAIPDIMFIIDKDGTYLDFHTFEAEKLAIHPDEIIGKNICETGFTQDDLESINNTIKQSLQHKSIETVEYSLPTNNKRRWYQARISPYGTDTVLALVRDNTEQKEIEKKLKDSERLFREVFEFAPIGIYRTTPDGRIILSNETLWKMLGYSSFEELAQINLEEKGFHPDYRRSFFKDEIKKHGTVKGLEATWIRKDGTKISVRENAYAIYNLNGDIGYYEGTVEDITEKKQIEKLLRKSKEEYRLLIENQQDIILKLDGQGSVQYVSPSFVTLTGCINQTPIGEKLEQFIHKDDQEIFTTMIQAIKGRKESLYLESRLLTKDGWCWIAWRFNPAIKEEDGTISLITTGRDITKQKEAELQLSKTKDRLIAIVDNAREFITTFDSNLRVSTWNRTAEKITGFSKNMVLAKRPTRLSVFHSPDDLEKNLSEIFSKKRADLDMDLLLNTKEGKWAKVLFSSVILRNNDNEPSEILLTGRCETDKRMETLAGGNAYLYMDQTKMDILKRMQHYIEKGYTGLSITRGTNEYISDLTLLSNHSLHIFSNERIDAFQTISSPTEIVEQIKSFLQSHESSVIFVDRLDFLLIHYPFEEIMRSIYHLHSLIIPSKSILFINVNTLLFTKQQIALLKEELAETPSADTSDINLESDVYAILEHIYKENEINSIVSYKNIGSAFQISKVTTQKRINSLQEKGLVTIKKRGKMKILFVTEKARKILKKR
jgi:PAS domain S-box-containing protein